MHYRELPAPPPLDDVIRCFWFLRGSGEPGPLQPVVPDGRIELILHLAQPFALVSTGGASRQSDAVISGQLSGPVLLQPSSEIDIVGIRFRTAAAGRALGLPLHVLTDQIIPLADAAPRLSDELLCAASRAATPVARMARMADVLVRRLDPSPRDAVVDATVVSLAHARTAAPVAWLSREAGLTVRTLERRVQAAVGLSPKQLHRILRFRRAFHALEGLPRGRWTRAAMDAGYYDQAHLIRDFRRLAGAPPTVFFAGGADLARAIMSRSYNRAVG